MFKKTSHWFWNKEPQCWFWNVEEINRDYFIKQLKCYNKLTQNSEYDLTILKNKKHLNLQEKWVWNQCSQMLCEIKEDDLIVIKNIPDSEHFTLVQIVGKYSFEENEPDYFLPIKIIGEFYKYSSIVPPSLLRTLHQEHNLIELADSNQRNIIDTLSSKLLQGYKPSNIIVELWQRAEEYLGRVGAVIVFLFTIIEIMSAVEGTVVDYAEFVAIINRWYWALR